MRSFPRLQPWSSTIACKAVLTLSLIATLASCADESILPSDRDEAEEGETGEDQSVAAEKPATGYTDPWYFCVDHPCPNLAAINFGGCPYSSGLLEVGVKNVGNADANATKTSIEFVGHSTLQIDTPALRQGAQSVVWVVVPKTWRDACKTATCKWTVKADSSDIVSEVDGKNNSLSGTCWLP